MNDRPNNINDNNIPMNVQTHFDDITEDNKENLPPWLCQQLEPVWARARAVADHAERTALARGRIRRKPNQNYDEDLVRRLATISICGRGGVAPQSATVPSTRPRRRAQIPDDFGFVIHTDPPSPESKETEQLVVPKHRITPEQPIIYEQPIVYEPEVFLPDYVLRPGRPRAATFPGCSKGDAADQTFGFQSRMPFSLLERGEMKAGRRVRSMTVRSVNDDSDLPVIDFIRGTGQLTMENLTLHDKTNRGHFQILCD